MWIHKKKQFGKYCSELLVVKHAKHTQHLSQLFICIIVIYQLLFSPKISIFAIELEVLNCVIVVGCSPFPPLVLVMPSCTHCLQQV